MTRNFNRRFAGIRAFSLKNGNQCLINDAGTVHTPDCYRHGFADTVTAALSSGLRLCAVEEPGDVGLPRLLVMGFQVPAEGPVRG